MAGTSSSTSTGLQAPAHYLPVPKSYQAPLAAGLRTSLGLEARSLGLLQARACSFFATCHPGLEQAVARELSEAVPGSLWNAIRAAVPVDRICVLS